MNKKLTSALLSAVLVVSPALSVVAFANDNVQAYVIIIPDEYNISTDPGSVIDESRGSYTLTVNSKAEPGDTVSVTVNPTPSSSSGYWLDFSQLKLSLDGGSDLSNSDITITSPYSFNFVMPESNVTINWDMAELDASIGNGYLPTTVIPTGAGSIKGTNDEVGEVNNVVITANAGYKFVDASVVCSNGMKVATTPSNSDGSSFTFTTPYGADPEVTANFEPETVSDLYDITVEAGENGSATSNVDSADAGTEITITVSPAPGYELDSITGEYDNGVDQGEVELEKQDDGTYTFTLQGDTTIVVTFKQIDTPPASSSYPVNYYINNQTLYERGEYSQGDTVTLISAPERAGYTFMGWICVPDTIGNAVDHVYQPGYRFTITNQGATLFAWYIQNSVNNGTTTPTPGTPSTPNTSTGINNGVSGSGAGFTAPGSSTRPNANGSSTIYTQDTNGTKTATTVDSKGNVTDVQVTIPSKGISNGVAEVDLGKNSKGETVKIPGDISVTTDAPEVTVSLPTGTTDTTVVFELQENTGLPGTVAMIKDANGNWVPIADSVAVGDDFYVPANGGSTTIMIKDNSKSFNDVSSSAWYDDAVAFISARGIMNGSAGAGSTTFNPNGTLTRAMLAQMIYNMENPGKTNNSTNPWYAIAQSYVVSKGLMGVASPFNPDLPITRQDLALVLWRNAGSPAVSTSVLNKYSDRNEVSNYALSAVAWAVENGIIGNNSNLNPAADASRAEIAKMFAEYITALATK